MSSTRPIMIGFQAANSFILAVKFLLVLSQSLNNMDICKEVAFYRRPELDDVVFTESLIEEINQVDTRTECFAQCHRRDLCNLVLYNPLTRKCRLYTDVFGSVSDGRIEAGWQYYGISCANFKLDNAQADADVINTARNDVCHSNITPADDNTSSCYAGASWEVVPVKCVSCYTGLPRQYANPQSIHMETLTFALGAGMKIKLGVAGDTENNHVRILNSNNDEVYVVSLRWNKTPTEAAFNTRQGPVFGAAEILRGLSVNNISNYSIEIHINQTHFETYVDGDLWMINRMRLPFSGARYVGIGGFTELRSFHVGDEKC